MAEFIAAAPCRFDRDYGIGEIIPDGVVHESMERKLIALKKIARVPITVAPATQATETGITISPEEFAAFEAFKANVANHPGIVGEPGVSGEENDPTNSDGKLSTDSEGNDGTGEGKTNGEGINEGSGAEGTEKLTDDDKLPANDNEGTENDEDLPPGVRQALKKYGDILRTNKNKLLRMTLPDLIVTAASVEIATTKEMTKGTIADLIINWRNAIIEAAQEG